MNNFENIFFEQVKAVTTNSDAKTYDDVLDSNGIDRLEG